MWTSLWVGVVYRIFVTNLIEMSALIDIEHRDEELYRAYKLAMSRPGMQDRDAIYEGNLFDFDEGATVADMNNIVAMQLADILNSNKPTALKNYFKNYNEAARESAAGQLDIFAESGRISQKEIVNNILKNIDYGTEQTSAKPGRKESIEQGGHAGNSNRADDVAEVEGEINIKNVLDKPTLLPKKDVCLCLLNRWRKPRCQH